MRNVSVLLAVVCLAGCSDSAVKDAVRDTLIDPDSAKFGDIVYSKNGNWACAETNAKNRMGGYTGSSQIVLVKIEGDWKVVDNLKYDQESCLKIVNDAESSEANDREGARDSATVSMAKPIEPRNANKATAALVSSSQNSAEGAPDRSLSELDPQERHVTIPLAFRGEWNEDLETCGSALNDSRLLVEARRVRFYESDGGVQQVVIRNARSVTVEAKFTSEGKVWTDQFDMMVSPSGQELTIRGTTRYRCQS